MQIMQLKEIEKHWKKVTTAGQLRLYGKILFKINLMDGHFGLVGPFCPCPINWCPLTIKRQSERAKVFL